MSESPLLAGLNPQQREAVLATEGPVLILAGAGSGKTRVITHRLAHLILEKGVSADALLAVTFTNKAAGEMKARAQALLEGRALTTWISTFHSFCVRLLRREAAAAGLKPGFLIYDEDDQLQAVREALRALDLSEKLHPARRILSRISAHKNSGREPEVEGGSFAEGTYARIAARYRETLQAAGALDFDDLLLKSVSLLQGDAAARERWQRRFRYLLVDEYQDTNAAQYELVRLLAGEARNVTVVGDEDQSIYSWRGARISNILDFEKDFPGARVLRLEDNYRSTQAILDAASALVAHNRRRKGKTLRAVKAAGDKVSLYEAQRRVRRGGARGPGDRGGPREPGRGALPDERAEPALRRGAAAAAHPLRGRGRRGLLRAQGGPGHPRLSAAGVEPRRRGGLPPGAERARPRHRRAHRGRDRAPRWRAGGLPLRRPRR